jgi:cytochrome b561
VQNSLTILFPARIIWICFREEPSPVKGTSKAQHKIEHLAHALIYISISAVLITGYLMIPEGYDFFGLLTIVTPFHKGEATEFFFILHRISCAVLTLLILVHVGAVVQHYVFHRVNILKRMI